MPKWKSKAIVMNLILWWRCQAHFCAHLTFYTTAQCKMWNVHGNVLYIEEVCLGGTFLCSFHILHYMIFRNMNEPGNGCSIEVISESGMIPWSFHILQYMKSFWNTIATHPSTPTYHRLYRKSWCKGWCMLLNDVPDYLTLEWSYHFPRKVVTIIGHYIR